MRQMTARALGGLGPLGAALLCAATLLTSCGSTHALEPVWSSGVETGSADQTSVRIAVTDDSVWVSSSGLLSRLSADSGELESSVETSDPGPAAMDVSDTGAVWIGVSGPEGKQVVEVDSETGEPDRVLPIEVAFGTEILDIAVEDLVWVSMDDGEILTVNPETGSQKRIMKALTRVDSLVADSGVVWMLQKVSAATMFDPTTGEILKQVKLPGVGRPQETGPSPCLVGTGGHIWIARSGDPPVVVLDAATGEVESEPGLAREDSFPGLFAADGDIGYLEVAGDSEGGGGGERVVVIDTSEDHDGEVQSFSLGAGDPVQMAAKAGHVFLASVGEDGPVVERYDLPDS